MVNCSSPRFWTMPGTFDGDAAVGKARNPRNFRQSAVSAICRVEVGRAVAAASHGSPDWVRTVTSSPVPAYGECRESAEQHPEGSGQRHCRTGTD